MAREFGMNAARRWLTLQTHTIHALPIVILMPHSGCNCRCVMCDIWRGNATQQLTESDVRGLLASLRQLHTQWVVMSGGEALLNPNLFRLCDLLRQSGLRVSILSTGLLLARYAADIAARTDEVIVSLDGPEAVHDDIRQVPGAFQKLQRGVQAVKSLRADFPLSARCVIQRRNFAHWPAIVEAARQMGLDSISFLPADVTSEAFNRPGGWDAERAAAVRPAPDQLPALKAAIEALIAGHAADFASGFIAESPDKLRRIHTYYAALHGRANFPPVACNAPWVSAVVEADGAVRPCFFHPPQGNIRDSALPEILNSSQAVQFRQTLNLQTDSICRTCVCTLNLRPTVKL